MVNFAAAGSYQISVSAAQRGNIGTSNEEVQVLVDGTVVGTFTPASTSYATYTTASFNVTAGSHTITFVGVDPTGKDYTAFLDQGGIDNVSPTGFTDPSFENPSKGTGGSAYQYDPTGSAWSFSGSAGLAGNGSGFTAGNPNAPQGSQVAFLQETGTISQVVNFAAAGSYQISVSAAQRGNFGTSNEEVQVLVDGTVVGTITPASTSYATYTTASFNVTAGSHTITFVGVDPTGKDYTAFLDQVSIDIVSPTGDWFSRNMTDPGLQDLARSDFNRDSSLTYSDMLNLFAAAESAGSVTSAELQSLQALVTIGGAAAVNMSGSVQSLTYKVVDGDPANAQFLGGRWAISGWAARRLSYNTWSISGSWVWTIPPSTCNTFRVRSTTHLPAAHSLETAAPVIRTCIKGWKATAGCWPPLRRRPQLNPL